MKIRITETSEIKEIKITDPATGTEWTTDLMGNHGVSMATDDDGAIPMSQEDFDWWLDLIGMYQQASDRLHRISRDLDDHQASELKREIDSLAVDLEDLPAYMMEIADGFEI